ncbi:MAG: MBL fold metallo-hydrolase [Smithellaceae bacterium]
MIIRCFGARGSIPVSGRDYLRYGGNTTCLEIRNSQGNVLLIDAGSGMREAGNTLIAEGCRDFTLVLTHAHWDHIMGFPFFKPLYRHDTSITVRGCAFAQDSIKDMLARVMTAPYFPINYDDVHAKIDYPDDCGGDYPFGDVTVAPIALSHPNQGTGYKFTSNGRSFVFLTDNELEYRHEGGLSYDDYLDFCRGADVLFHDAEYLDEEYPGRKGWGHSTIEQAINLALDAGVRQLGLFHHNQDRRDVQIDEMVRLGHQLIRKRKSQLDCFAVRQGMKMSL